MATCSTRVAFAFKVSHSRPEASPPITTDIEAILAAIAEVEALLKEQQKADERED
jgi:hypothetical protein